MRSACAFACGRHAQAPAAKRHTWAELSACDPENRACSSATVSSEMSSNSSTGLPSACPPGTAACRHPAHSTITLKHYTQQKTKGAPRPAASTRWQHAPNTHP
jgi:hypothetical protein